MTGAYPISGSNAIGTVFGPTDLLYYDRSGQLILYATLPDDNTALDDYQLFLTSELSSLDLWGFLIRASVVNNPNWPNLQDLSSATLNFLAGNGTVIQSNLDQVVVSNITPDQSVDYWWGSNTFAKFGWFAWNYLTPEMPVSFINCNPCYFWEELGNFNGFAYGMAGLTTAYGTCYSMLDVPYNYVGGEIWSYPR